MFKWMKQIPSANSLVCSSHWVGMSLQTGAPFTRVRTNFCTDKNLHGSTLCLHGAGGTGRILERLSVQVWDLLFLGPKLAHLGIR